MSRMQLPSGFQIGDEVQVYCPPSFIIQKATVIKVHFSESKVLYDLEIEIDYWVTPEDNSKLYTRIYNVDSAFLSRNYSSEPPCLGEC